MRSGHSSQLAGVTVGVSDRPVPDHLACHLSTLRHFDSEPSSAGQNDPLIPCERRLQEMEISEFQEVTFEQRFGNRDYDRPYGHFYVTLGRFD